jgi:hypothetical protein
MTPRSANSPIRRPARRSRSSNSKGVYHGYGDNIAPYNFHDWHMEYNAKADKETMDRTLSLIKSRSFQRGLEYK